MKKSLLFPFLFCSAVIFGQTPDDSLTSRLDDYFTALTNLKQFNGNVIISKNGNGLLDKSFNLTGENGSLKVTHESKFIIASVSKVFIKFGILKLAEMKKLNLSDKVNRFIPGFPDGGKISIEHLLYHQSGLPRELTRKEEFDSLSLSKIIELAKEEKLQFEPGSQTLYSNVGYFLLHYIIDKTSDSGYLNFIQDEIFRKMNLTNTLEFNSAATVPKFAYGFDNADGKIIATSKKNINKFETGNYLSTVGDLYRFSQQILSGNVLNPSLALHLFGKDSVLAQAGGRPGYRAYFYMNLKTRVTFIFVCNYTGIPFQETTAGILSILDGKPYQIPGKIHRVEIELPGELLKQYAGTYALEADQSMTVTLQLIGNRLYNVDTNGEKTELHADSETTFFEKPDTKDGYEFSFNLETKRFDLTITDTGLKLKTKRVD